MASHLTRDDELEPSIAGVFLCAPPFSDQVNDGTGKVDLVRVLSKDKPDQQHAPLQNETMTERFRGRWTNAMWLVSWINDFAELSQPAEGSSVACPLLFGTHKNIPPAYMTIQIPRSSTTNETVARSRQVRICIGWKQLSLVFYRTRI
jgi:hypothetical protein